MILTQVMKNVNRNISLCMNEKGGEGLKTLARIISRYLEKEVGIGGGDVKRDESLKSPENKYEKDYKNYGDE